MTALIQVGAQLEGRFTIRGELATREERTIYSGTDEHTGERCDAHLLAPSASEDARTEFTREAELLGRIDHPGFLSTAAFGGLPGGTLYFIVSERSARRASDRVGKALPGYHVADAAAQLLRALQHVHDLDWRIGWLTPEHIDERVLEGRVLVRVVRLPAASPAGQASTAPPTSPEYADPSMPPGATTTVESDIYSIGRIIHQLATGSVDVELPEATPRQQQLKTMIDGLCNAAKTPAFSNAGDAALAFEEFCAAHDGAIPPVPPAPRRSESRFRTSDIHQVSSVQRIPAATPHDNPPAAAESSRLPTTRRPSDPAGIIAPPSSTHLVDAPRPFRRNLMVAAALGALLLAGGIGFALRSGPEPTTTAPAVAAAAADDRAEGAPAALNVAGLGAGNDVTPQPSDPLHAVVLLNRTDLDDLLPYAKRHALLEQIAARDDLKQRVDQRWNRLADLAQAADSPTPCTTFRNALQELETPPRTPAEEALVATLRVPTKATVLGAGVAPDGHCDGLAEALAAVRPAEAANPDAAAPAPAPRPSARKKRTHNDRPRPTTQAAPPTAAAPAAAPPKKKQEKRSVATRLDDIKGVGF